VLAGLIWAAAKPRLRNACRIHCRVSDLVYPGNDGAALLPSLAALTRRFLSSDFESGNTEHA
jgi:hypothetical protein